jgi:hypothetical protein
MLSDPFFLLTQKGRIPRPNRDTGMTRAGLRDLGCLETAIPGEVGLTDRADELKDR